MRRAFGKTIFNLARMDKRIVLITGDVEQEITQFKQTFSDRYFNLGLCEQSIISIAAGLASEGMRPVVYSITPFLIERPFEQIKIDIDEQKLPVMLVGNSDYPSHGPTHRPLNAQGLCGLFKNVMSFFPRSQFEAEKAMLDAYIMGLPSIICLQNERLPIL